MDIDFKFQVFDKIQFDLDGILYWGGGGFEVAEGERERFGSVF